MSAVTGSLKPGSVSPRRRRIDWVRLDPWRTLLLAVLALSVGTPLVFLVLGSFSTARMPSQFTFNTLTLKNHIEVWSDPGTWAVFGNTFWYVIGSTVSAVAIAALLAWLVERTDMPGKIWVYAAIPMTLAMPGMLQAMAWVLLLSPKIGLFNKSLMQAFDLESAPLDIYSIGGMIFVETFRLVPAGFLMLSPLLRNMDPALEEAAAMSGASNTQIFSRITARLLAPGLAAIAIYQGITALEVFEIPGILGLPSGVFVFSTKIYAIMHSSSFLPNYGQANALATFYLAIAVVATLAYGRVLTRSERFSTVAGKAFRPRRKALGGWRHAALGLVGIYLLLSLLLPTLVLLYISFMPYLQTPSLASLTRATLDNYRAIFSMNSLSVVLWNTATLALVTSLATVAASVLISMVVVRSRFWGRKLIDLLAFVPHSIPGIVTGIAMLWVFLVLDRLGVGLFGGIWSVCIVFTIGFLAYGTRAMSAAILQIHKDIEEAAFVSGAPTWQVMRRILLPLLLPACMGIALWTILQSIRMASQPLILLEGAKNEVLAVTIWNLWGEGQAAQVGAIGVMMIAAMLALATLLRLVASRFDIAR